MTGNLKFIGWKLAELSLYVIGFPFLFIGMWITYLSDWCFLRATQHDPRQPRT